MSDRNEWEPAYQLSVRYAEPQRRGAGDMPEEMVVERWEQNALGEKRLAERWLYTRARKVVIE